MLVVQSRWTLCVISAYFHKDVFSSKCKSLRSNDLRYYWMEEPHHFPLGEAGHTLGKNRPAWRCILRVQAEFSLECYLNVFLEMRVHNWMEQVTGVHAKDRKGRKPQQKKIGAWGLTVVWFNWALYVSQIWRVRPVCYGRQWEAWSKEQETGGAREVAQNRSQRPRTKQERPHKDQVSQASAEKLHLQESWRGNDWKRGEKIESDSQKEN